MEASDDHTKALERDGEESKDIVLSRNQTKERGDTITTSEIWGCNAKKK